MNKFSIQNLFLIRILISSKDRNNMFEQYCNASILLLLKLVVIANNVIIVCTLTKKNHENCELKFNEEPSINDFDIV